jgi:hypothetical protein
MDARTIERTMLTLLAGRAPGATICPSEVARADGDPAWRDRMEAVRTVARALARAGRLEITQGGAAVPPDAPVLGPIRLRLPAGEGAQE